MTVTDHQVRTLRRLHLRQKLTLSQAAIKSAMTDKTARKYIQSGLLPSQMKKPRTWKTRTDPFEDIWPAVLTMLELHPKIEAKTLFEEIQRRNPGQFDEGQLRTFQRRVKTWKIHYGAPKEVFFEQLHQPAMLCQSDFTHMDSLAITIQGQTFKHMLYHFNLTYSNWEWATICHSESFENLAEGLISSLKKLGGVPKLHRTDNLAAAKKIGKPEFQKHYAALAEHFGMTVETTNPYSGHENGDVEQSHHRLKRTLEQAFMLRNSRDFESVQAYQYFLEQMLHKQNMKRQEKFLQEKALLKPLPRTEWMSCSHLRVRVSKSSTVRVKHKCYSVDSRLIGELVDIYVYAQRLEVWCAQKHMDTLPRLYGKDSHHIQYRHVIDWLVKKPKAFANYRYQAQFFPSTCFRMTYDQLKSTERGTKEYLEILQLALREGEEQVNECLRFLITHDCPLSLEEVKGLLGEKLPSATELKISPIDLSIYDQLLEVSSWR